MLTINELPAFHTDLRGASLVFLNLIYVSQVDDLLTVNELPTFHTDVRGVSLVFLNLIYVSQVDDLLTVNECQLITRMSAECHWFP